MPNQDSFITNVGVLHPLYQTFKAGYPIYYVEFTKQTFNVKKSESWLFKKVNVSEDLFSISLETNISNYDLLIISPHRSSQSVLCSSNLFLNTRTEELTVVGIPTVWKVCLFRLEAKTNVLDTVDSSIVNLELHQSIILKNCLSIPKITFLLQSAPCLDFTG